MKDKLQQELVINCHFRMDESLRMIAIALSKISEEQVWQKPNATLNSIGNLILHLCGNMTQYGIASMLDQVDTRQRHEEFDANGGYSKQELLEKLQQTIQTVKDTLATTTFENLLKKRKVQGFEFSGVGNSIHVVEHLSYHTGQIAFWVKLLKKQPLGFYDGMDLNQLNDTSLDS